MWSNSLQWLQFVVGSIPPIFCRSATLTTSWMRDPSSAAPPTNSLCKILYAVNFGFPQFFGGLGVLFRVVLGWVASAQCVLSFGLFGASRVRCFWSFLLFGDTRLLAGLRIAWPSSVVVAFSSLSADSDRSGGGLVGSLPVSR